MSRTAFTPDNVKREIEELHEFFEDWFNGSLERDEFVRFHQVTSADFELITPASDSFDQRTILDMVEQGYNSQISRRIWTENVKVRNVGDLMIATYHELQELGDSRTERISTAVFSEKIGAPNGCQWRHVHETWVRT